MKLTRPNKETLTIQGCTESEIESLIGYLTSKSWKAEYDFPTYPKWDNWSELIPLNISGRFISKEKLSEYRKTGVYKIYHKNKLIYIGETRSSTRMGMWARRLDFLSTVRGNEEIKNPYGNGTKFIEVFGVEEIKNVSHSFHTVHPIFCKDAELEQLQMFYDEHGNLPALQSEIDYKRISKNNNLLSFY